MELQTLQEALKVEIQVHQVSCILYFLVFFSYILVQVMVSPKRSGIAIAC